MQVWWVIIPRLPHADLVIHAGVRLANTTTLPQSISLQPTPISPTQT